jgi:hypothetical protein
MACIWESQIQTHATYAEDAVASLPPYLGSMKLDLHPKIE